MLELLRGGEMSVRELADALPISQPAVSQHLKVLRGAGLVASRDQGAARLYRVDLDGMAHVRAWVDAFWDDVLAAFVAHVAAVSEAAESAPSGSTSSGSKPPRRTSPRRSPRDIAPLDVAPLDVAPADHPPHDHTGGPA